MSEAARAPECSAIRIIPSGGHGRADLASFVRCIILPLDGEGTCVSQLNAYHRGYIGAPSPFLLASDLTLLDHRFSPWDRSPRSDVVRGDIQISDIRISKETQWR